MSEKLGLTEPKVLTLNFYFFEAGREGDMTSLKIRENY